MSALGRKLSALFVSLFIAQGASAADRALLVGVGDFADPTVTDLPGIDIDVRIMQGVASQLGFDESSVRVLADADATLENVSRSIEEWLVDGVGPDDRAMFYISTHGAQAPDADGDEPDGLDEFLVMHDFTMRDQVVYGALLDDHFYDMLRAVPTENLLIVVDACHSGTAYKTMHLDADYSGNTGVSKLHRIPGVGKASSDSLLTEVKGSGGPFVALMAADDTQSSIATNRGSVFTLGIEKIFGDALTSGQALTPREANEQLRRFVKRELQSDPGKIFTPQVGGRSDLLDRPLRLQPAPPPPTAAWEALDSAVAGTAPLAVSASGTQFRIGESTLRISVEVPAAGYLNIVTVDPAGDNAVLYPNQFNPTNAVTPGTLSVPTPQMNFDLTAQGPEGDHLVAAIWTADPLNLYETGVGKRDDNGNMMSAFAELSSYGARTFVATARQNADVRAGKVVLQVVQ